MLSNSNLSDKSRLMIHRLELENFKSYGGKTVIGPFHKDFTSVVGPNGSGKSNVIDALLFVFGKRSKSIRATKLSEVYFKSPNSVPADRCQVTVYFQRIIDRPSDEYSDNNYVIEPGSEFSVSRKLVGNSSTYWINNMHVEFDEVRKVFSRHGVITDDVVGIESHRFIIPQGEVEQISTMSPKCEKKDGDDGLLEYIEKTIGSDRYIENIRVANEKVADLNLEIEAQERVCDGYDAALAQVDEKRKKATESLLRDRDLLWNLSISDQQKIRDSRKNLEDAVLKLQDTENELSSKVLQQNQKQIDLSKVEEDRSVIKNELSNLRSKDAALSKNLQTFQADLHKKEAVQAEKRDELARSIDKIAKTSSKLKSKMMEIEEGKKRIPELRRLLESTTPLLEDARQKRNEFLASAEKKKLSLLSEKSEILVQNDAVLKEYDRLKLIQENDRRSHEEALDILHSKDKEINLKTKRLNEENSSANSLTHEIAKLSADMNALENNDLPARIEGVNKEIASLTVEKDKLAKLIEFAKRKADAEMKRKEGQIVQVLLEAALPGGPLENSGLLGTLGSLGDIEEEYKIAATIASPKLGYLVVRTKAGLDQILDFLKSRNLGRFKFLLLDTVLHRERSGLARADSLTSPAGSKFLYSLISPREFPVQSQKQVSPNAYATRDELRTLFFSAFRQTLVTDTLNTARRIMDEKGRRVVTLNGELFEPSGAITGGGSQKPPVRIGTHNLLLAELSKVSHQRSARGSDDIHPVSEESDTSDDDVRNTGKIRAESATDLRSLHELNVDMERVSSRLGLLTRQKADLDEEMGAAPEKYLKLKNRHKVAQEKLSVTLATISNLTNEIKSLREVSVDDSEQKMHVEKCRKQLEESKKRFLNAEESKNAVELLVNELTRKIETVANDPVTENNLKKNENICKDLKKSIQMITDMIAIGVKAEEAEIGRDEESKRNAEVVLSNLTESIESLMSEIALIQREVDNLKQKIYEMESRLRECESEVSVLHSQLREIDDSVKRLKDRKKTLETQRKAKKSEEDSRMKAWTEHGRMYRSIIESTIVAPAQAKANSEQLLGVFSGDSMEAISSQADFDPSGETQLPMDSTIISADQPISQNSCPDDTRPEFFIRIDERTLACIDPVHRDRLWYRTLDPSQLDVFVPTSQVSVDESSLDIMKEYVMRLRESGEQKAKLQSLMDKQSLLLRELKNWNDIRLEEFMKGFRLINEKLSMIYRMITKGLASLELLSKDNPFQHGIEYMVSPPGKYWCNISTLSGGEKTLSSLALIFALQECRGLPFFVLDEVDAALDPVNVSVIAEKLRMEASSRTQFIIISLRNEMFELADRLVGVCKVDGVSNSVTVNPGQIARQVKRLRESVFEEEEN